NGTFTLERIEQILDVIELDLEALARLVRDGSSAPDELTHEQEAALAQDARLFSVFWLIQNEWSFGETLAAFAITRAELTGSYARLERMKLIRWGPRDRARLLLRRDFRYRDGGPIKKTYGLRAMNEFLAARFKAPLEFIRFESRVMSPESAAILKRRVERQARRRGAARRVPAVGVLGAERAQAPLGARPDIEVGIRTIVPRRHRI